MRILCGTVAVDSFNEASVFLSSLTDTNSCVPILGMGTVMSADGRGTKE